MDVSELLRRNSDTSLIEAAGLATSNTAPAAEDLRTVAFVDRELERARWMECSLRPLDWVNQSLDPSLHFSIISEMQRAQRELNEQLTWFLDGGRRAMAIFNAQLTAHNELLRWFEQFPCDDLFPELDQFLIEQGWYLSNDLPASIVFDISDFFDASELNQIEQYLCKVYRYKTDEVEPNVIKWFPRRQRLLAAAFRAHHAQDYALSVPAFLTQIDGISRELWRANFFRTGQSNKNIGDLLREGRIAPLSPTQRRQLLERGSIRAPSNREQLGYRFNRHDILHGNDTQFDREEYSLRCIALLDFMLSLCPLFDAN
jgi:hypothetical protein